MIIVTGLRLPNVAVGEAFEMTLPVGAEVLRAGIDPANGSPTLWIKFFESKRHSVYIRRFIGVETAPGAEARIDNKGDTATPCGTWWAAGQTYHLFELIAL